MKLKVGNRQIIIKVRFIIIVGLIAVLIAGYFILGKKMEERYTAGLEKAQVEVLGKQSLSSSAESKEQAIRKLKENYKNKFVIIFFYDGYKDQNEALNYVAVMKAVMDLIEPFKNSKELIVYKTFTTDSPKCKVENNEGKKFLVCDEKLINSFKNLGIDHFKLVILSPLEFSSTSLPAQGSNSWMTISTFQGDRTQDDNKRLAGLTFAQNLGRSLGLQFEENSSTPSGTLMSSNPTKESYSDADESYLRAVLYCFYGNRQKPLFPAGQEASESAKFGSCDTFKKEHEEFWKK